MNLRLNAQKIRQKIYTKYQGVLLDEHLFFKDHIKGTLMQISKSGYILVFTWKQYPENFELLILKFCELFSAKTCEMFVYKRTETIESVKK